MKELRESAVDFLLMAGKDEEGRRQFDPLFDAVTEKRQTKGYSACGDLGHWLLFRMGFRFPWINRDEHRGWLQARNLSLLCSSTVGGKNPIARPPRVGQLVDAGDVLVVAGQVTKSHLAVVLGPASLEPRSVVRTVEYGQFNARYGRASGRVFSRMVNPAMGCRPGMRLGNLTLDSVLSLTKLAELDVDHVEADNPIRYYERIGARQRTLRLAQPNQRGTDVRWWQESLEALGHTPGRIDDVFGKRVEEATGAFQESIGLEATRRVETDEWCAMMGWSPTYATAEEAPTNG
ncbi:MAG: peptidoglycan-binding domain-containing protein [Acidobacteriia bacterium]|nr:peptidoglycan-binding domain-containing protein [Terriglobia bacterium]